MGAMTFVRSRARAAGLSCASIAVAWLFACGSSTSSSGGGTGAPTVVEVALAKPDASSALPAAPPEAASASRPKPPPQDVLARLFESPEVHVVGVEMTKDDARFVLEAADPSVFVEVVQHLTRSGYFHDVVVESVQPTGTGRLRAQIRARAGD